MPHIRGAVRSAAPSLVIAVDALAQQWLSTLLNKIDGDAPFDFRPKQINDPVWGTIELMPWEVAILDTPLLQRMRGVRQLGLAQLVFPSASHGRLEHTIGVIGAIEESARSLSRQIERWNRTNQTKTIPPIDDAERHAIRIAALLHDIGHGPFSHALEPVLEVDAPLGEISDDGENWRAELVSVRQTLMKEYELNKPPAVSEAIAIMLVLSDAMHHVLKSDKVITERKKQAEDLSDAIVAAIIGALKGPGASHLSGLVSSQIDADKLDYLARDAHHSGLEIGFDTDRLLAKLEILRVREENLDGNAFELRKRAAESPEGTFLQLGIAASGFGSFEQMLIGRTFLYDRLYHHHKVRAAEAMAQRLMIVAERDRQKRFTLNEIFLTVDDETLLRIFAREVSHKEFAVESHASAKIARRILDRDLFHRAFAFRGRFIALPAGISPETIEQTQNSSWGRIVGALEGLKSRYELGAEIHTLALSCCKTIAASGIDQAEMARYLSALNELGPEQIIVDLPTSKTEGIRILARYPNGAIKVPEFSFNPQKWTDAYDLQKRTGYVFCPREVAPVIGLASKIVFLGRFGVVMAAEADGYIKAMATSEEWFKPLVAAGIMDADAVTSLITKRSSLLSIRPEDLRVPDGWLKDDEDLAVRLSVQLQSILGGGLTASDLKALSNVLRGMFLFADTWIGGNRATSELESERDLQKYIKESLEMCGLSVTEGSKLAGGELDLYVNNAIIVENKFHSGGGRHETATKSAAMQGRRYAIALGSQIVIVVSAYRPTPGEFPNKPATVSVRAITENDSNRAEIRFNLPYGAVRPSAEKSTAT